MRHIGAYISSGESQCRRPPLQPRTPSGADRAVRLTGRKTRRVTLTLSLFKTRSCTSRGFLPMPSQLATTRRKKGVGKQGRRETRNAGVTGLFRCPLITRPRTPLVSEGAQTRWTAKRSCEICPGDGAMSARPRIVSAFAFSPHPLKCNAWEMKTPPTLPRPNHSPKHTHSSSVCEEPALLLPASKA
ncbi:hypothetical protein P4O66_021245 [Electrophorus voltai]|uniref:Uncharacterized protein n=1 Tax=Electrophorus voltai TaxID=2609070 RepID=A0AAD8ZNP8_9TELE|nr:hypothetical protein P4O66_021245 [Electrophorus voltai]